MKFFNKSPGIMSILMIPENGTLYGITCVKYMELCNRVHFHWSITGVIPKKARIIWKTVEVGGDD